MSQLYQFTAGVNLPAPAVIAQEIVENLQAALEQFKLIAADLEAAASLEAG